MATSKLGALCGSGYVVNSHCLHSMCDVPCALTLARRCAFASWPTVGVAPRKVWSARLDLQGWFLETPL